MAVILSLATLLIAAATVLPAWRNPHWATRAFDFPRLQIACLGTALLVALWIFLDARSSLAWLLGGITLLCTAWQVRYILPYSLLWPKQVKDAVQSDPDRRLSILIANILTPNRKAAALLDLVREYQPDILVTLESDQWWQDQLDLLESDMPYTVKCPMDNLYGMHLYSRIPIEEEEVAFLVENDVPSIHTLLRLRTGDVVRAHFLHPAPPSPTENTESTQRDAELVVVARRVKECTLPVIVTGDLNDAAWSRTTRLFRKISGLLDPRVGRGMFNTFHAGYPFLRWPLDHVFHSTHFTLRRLQRLPDIGSDHFPLFAELVFAPAHGLEQSAPVADATDRNLAREIANANKVNVNPVPRPGKQS